MEAGVRLASIPLPPSYAKQDICSIIHNNRTSKPLIYFSPKYTLDKNGRDALYADLHWAALAGGDRLTLWGRGKASTQVIVFDVSVPLYTVVAKLTKQRGP